jgi:hypothetical protein
MKAMTGNKSKGAPGLAFETWGTRNRAPMEALPSPLSSRAQPRDLQFSGPCLEMFLTAQTLKPLGKKPIHSIER